MNFINELYSSIDGFSVWHEILKGLISGAFAFLVAYFSVVKTYRNDKKKDREKEQKHDEQTFEYLRVITHRAYRDVNLQTQYFLKFLKDLKVHPHEPPCPISDAKRYLEIFVKEIDKKDYYFSMINYGKIKGNEVIKLQSLLFYFHGAFEMLYGSSVIKHDEIYFALRRQYKEADNELLALITNGLTAPTHLNDVKLAQTLSQQITAFTNTPDGRNQHHRAIVLIPELIKTTNIYQNTSENFRSRLLIVLQRMRQLDFDIGSHNQRFSENLKEDYRQNFLRALVDLRKECKKINEFVFRS